MDPSSAPPGGGCRQDSERAQFLSHGGAESWEVRTRATYIGRYGRQAIRDTLGPASMQSGGSGDATWLAALSVVFGIGNEYLDHISIREAYGGDMSDLARRSRRPNALTPRRERAHLPR